MRLENVIFSNLVNNEAYARKVIPFLKGEYFQDKTDQIVFELIENHVNRYKGFPTPEALVIDLLNKSDMNENQFSEAKELIGEIKELTLIEEAYEPEWLLDKTEEFCKDKALYNALMQAIQVVDGDKSSDRLSAGSIPQLLSDALGVSFDTNIGHDYLVDAEDRFDFFSRKEHKIPFDLEFFNKITKGGVSKKTLNIALAGTGVGKSLFMCHCAAHNIMSGLNVLYITLEMAEERISERIDANLLDIKLDDLVQMPKDTFVKKINKLRKKTDGKLIVKEYPTACAGSANFRHLLNELALKKKFKPDIIYIDYLNICISSRIKASANANSYTYIKAIAEELRGLAIEFNVPIFSATQTTRGGYDSSDLSLTDTSESFGLPATADFMFGLVSNEQLNALNQILVIQLKNRYGDLNYHKKFVVGVDRAKMRLYDTEQSAQEGLTDAGVKKDEEDDTPVFDHSDAGNRMNDDPEYRKSKLRTLI